MHRSRAHAKQLFTYLKLKGLKRGYLFNFGGDLMKDRTDHATSGLPEEKK